MIASALLLLIYEENSLDYENDDLSNEKKEEIDKEKMRNK